MTEANKQWYKQEYKSRNAGTSRSVGASAVTGHAKAKSGRTNARGKQRHGEGESVGKQRPVKTAKSMLSVVANKDQMFG